MKEHPRPPKMVCVGRIGAAVGIKGQMRLITSVEDISLLTCHPLYYGKALAQSCHIRIVGAQKEVPLIVIDGVNDRTQAEGWRHRELYLPRDALSEVLPDGEYYINDLIGMSVRTSEGAEVGSVKAVYNFGAGDILEITFADGKEEMLIFTDDNFPHVDMANGHILYHPPEILSTT